MKKATIEELAAVPGMNRPAAEKISAHLNNLIEKIHDSGIVVV